MPLLDKLPVLRILIFPVLGPAAPNAQTEVQVPVLFEHQGVSSGEGCPEGVAFFCGLGDDTAAVILLVLGFASNLPS